MALKYEDIKIKDYGLPQLRFGVQHYGNSTILEEFTLLCDTKLRMKSISALAILQIEVILKLERLHRSFRKSCSV